MKKNIVISLLLIVIVVLLFKDKITTYDYSKKQYDKELENIKKVNEMYKPENHDELIKEEQRKLEEEAEKQDTLQENKEINDSNGNIIGAKFTTERPYLSSEDVREWFNNAKTNAIRHVSKQVNDSFNKFISDNKNSDYILPAYIDNFHVDCIDESQNFEKIFEDVGYFEGRRIENFDFAFNDNFNNVGYIRLGVGCGWWCGTSEVKSIKATSTLKPEGNINYGAYNMLSESRKTTWAEGVKGSGEGEKITLIYEDEFADGYDKTEYLEICIANGIVSNPTIWQANNRVEKLKLYFNNEYVGTIKLMDTYYPQYINIMDYNLKGKTQKENSFTFEIESVYRGTTYDDTCISYIELNQILCGHGLKGLGLWYKPENS